MEKTKEVLHTQGEWESFIQPSKDDGLVTTINVGSKRIATLLFRGIEETEANAEIICRSVNQRQYLSNLNVKICELNKQLIDSNRELIEAVKVANNFLGIVSAIFENRGLHTTFYNDTVKELQTAINNNKI